MTLLQQYTKLQKMGVTIDLHSIALSIKVENISILDIIVSGTGCVNIGSLLLFEGTIPKTIIPAIKHTYQESFTCNTIELLEESIKTAQSHLKIIFNKMQDLLKQNNTVLEDNKLLLAGVTYNSAEIYARGRSLYMALSINMSHDFSHINRRVGLIGPSIWRLIWGITEPIYSSVHDADTGSPFAFKSLLASRQYPDIMINPHIHTGQGGNPCLGGFAYPLHYALNEFDLFGALLTIKQFNSTIDPRDSWGKANRLLPQIYNLVGIGKASTNPEASQYLGIKHINSLQDYHRRGSQLYNKEDYRVDRISNRIIKINKAARISLYIDENCIIQHIEALHAIGYARTQHSPRLKALYVDACTEAIATLKLELASLQRVSVQRVSPGENASKAEILRTKIGTLVQRRSAVLYIS